jgi:hypothetical protein
LRTARTLAGGSASHSRDEAGDDRRDDDDWPTLPPPFDLEDFAKERMSSERDLVAPPDRPTLPAPSEAVISGTRVRARDADRLAGSSVDFGSLNQVPRLVVPLHELRNLSLDHESGFLLSRVDGVSTLDTLLDVCAMPRVNALRLVAKLVDYGVIDLESDE